MIIEANMSGTHDQERSAHAMADPEIQVSTSYICTSLMIMTYSGRHVL